MIWCGPGECDEPVALRLLQLLSDKHRHRLTVEDLQSANSLELAMIPRIGAKSLALLYELKGEKVPDVPVLCGKAKRFRSMLGTSGGSRL